MSGACLERSGRFLHVRVAQYWLSEKFCTKSPEGCDGVVVRYVRSCCQVLSRLSKLQWTFLSESDEVTKYCHGRLTRVHQVEESRVICCCKKGLHVFDVGGSLKMKSSLVFRTSSDN